MTLVIGGSKHGELVDWPTDRRMWAIPIIDHPQIALQHVEPDIVGPTVRTEYYIAEKLMLFEYPVWVWRHDGSVKPWIDPREFARLLLPEILSYKGARMFQDSGVNL